MSLGDSSNTQDPEGSSGYQCSASLCPVTESATETAESATVTETVTVTVTVMTAVMTAVMSVTGVTAETTGQSEWKWEWPRLAGGVGCSSGPAGPAETSERSPGWTWRACLEGLPERQRVCS